MLPGQMQDVPLLISALIDFAAKNHGESEIVSRTVEGPIHRYTYAEARERSRKLAAALKRFGIQEGERIGTLAWNGYRHLELYFGVSGMGAVLHTINPRLFAEQIAYIANHAQDRVLFLDLSFVSLVEEVAEQLTSVEAFVIMSDREHMPETKLPKQVLCYEEFIASESEGLEWPMLDERAASSLCYTSGTTGNPKGVLYSHRSTVLHSFAVCMGDGVGVNMEDVVIPVVPMFHANAWGLVYAAAMCGAKLVLPGSDLSGAAVYELMAQEECTVSAGVPTVWLMLLDHLAREKKTLEHLRAVVIGGSAVPGSMIEGFENDHDVRVFHIWGMTELSPLGTVSHLKRKDRDKPLAETLHKKLKQGRAIYSVELKITDDDGNELPHDGKAAGHLMVRGPWVVSRYFGDDKPATDADGWFDTGDVANIDEDGFMQITDRAKDVIKSGGEWISSIDLENAAVGHPGITEAAVIGRPHEKWGERPLLVLVRSQGSEVQGAEIRSFLEDKVAKWWLPDDIVFVDELPHTATGKLKKTALREQFRDHTWPQS